MRQMVKRIAAAGAAALCVAAAGCSKQLTLDPADALAQLKDEITFTDQMTDMDSESTCRFYDVDTGLVNDSSAYVGSGATAESMAVFEAVDADAAGSIAGALQSFTDGWIAGYSDYKPEEVPSWRARCWSRMVYTLYSACRQTIPRPKPRCRIC